MATLRRIACLLASEKTPERAQDLLDVALAHSPQVEEGGAGLVYLDVAGLRGLYGSEEEIGRHLARAATDRELSVRVGIAQSRIGALIAARRGRGVTIIDAGKDAQYLAAAPLSLLDLTDEMAARLERWGLRTLGELAALPSAALFERLGSEGIALQRLARGEDARPLRPWEPPLFFEESIEPGWAVETLGALGDMLAELVERICERLVRRGLSADRFDWACRLSDRTVHEGNSSPAVPVNETAAATALLGASLESRPPRGAVEAVTLRAHPVRVAPAQESLTDRSRPSARMLTTILARLAAIVGAKQIGVPELLDSHRPDAVTLTPPHPDPFHEEERTSRSLSPQRRGGISRSLLPQGREGISRSLLPQGREGISRSLLPQGREGISRSLLGRGQDEGPLALRRLRPPCPARVTLTAGRPVHLQSDRLTARIVASVGPWRSSGEWWTECPWIHDEWDAELADGTLCRLAHDGSTWRLEGIYD